MKKTNAIALMTGLTLIYCIGSIYAQEAAFEARLGGDARAAISRMPKFPSDSIPAAEKILISPPAGMETCAFTEAKDDTCLFKCKSGATVTRPRLNSSVAQNGGCAIFVMVPKQPAVKAAATASEEAVLEIISKEKISLRATATYMASNEIPGCAQTSFSDGQMETLPLVFDREIPVTAGAGGSLVSFALKLPGKCASKLAGFTLRADHPKVSPDFNSIGLEFSRTNQDVDVQKVVFTKIQSPWLGEIWTTSGKSILIGPNGKAKAELILE